MASLHTSPWKVISWVLPVPAVIMQFSGLVNMTSANCTTLILPAQPSPNLIAGYDSTLMTILKFFLVLDEKRSCQIAFCSLCRESPAHTYLNYCFLKLLWYSFSLGSTNHSGNSKHPHTSSPSCVLSLRDYDLKTFGNWGCHRALVLPVLFRSPAAELLSASDNPMKPQRLSSKTEPNDAFIFISFNKKFLSPLWRKSVGFNWVCFLCDSYL